MQDGPWSKYQSGPPPAPAGAPSIIQGPPKGLDPGEAERLALSRNADARAAEANARANAAAERQATAAERQNNNLNENQAKATGFYVSARGAEDEWKALEADPSLKAGTQPPGLLGDAARAVLPANVVNTNTSSARQRAQQAKDNFIRASLRLESGAAIGPAEFARQDRIFYPQTGDSADTIAQKARARQQVIDGFKIQAGPGAAKAEALPGGDHIDTSHVLALSPSQGRAQANSSVKTVENPAMKAIAPELGSMVASGASDDQIEAFMRQKGIDPATTNIGKVLNYRNSGEFKLWKQQNPGKAYPINTQMEVPLTDREKADAELAASPLGAAAAGAADTVTLGFADEIAGMGNAQATDEFRRKRDIMSNANPWPFIGGQLAGGLLPIGRIAGLGSGATRSALSMGREGSVLGGIYGAGSSDPDAGTTVTQAMMQRGGGAVAGAALGGSLSYGLGALGNHLSKPPSGPTPPSGTVNQHILASAADEEGVPISRPIIDPSRRDAMSYLESSIGGGNVVRKSLEKTAQALEGRASALGGKGTAQEAGTMGQRIQDAGERYIARSRTIKDKLYDRAAQIAGRAAVKPKEAVRVLDEQIADLSKNANANAPQIKYLEEIRGDLTDDVGNVLAKDVGGIRDLRTSMRGQINTRNLTATDTERRLGLVLDAARSDIQRDLSQKSPAAVRAYQRADKFYAARQSEIKQVVQRVIGRPDDKLGGGQVWDRIKTMASGKDADRLSRMWSKLEPEEQRDAAATIAASLGRRSAEEEFSPARFVNSVRALSPTARQTIFGPDGARSISNLRLLSEAYRDTAARLNNSRSGQVLQWGNFLRNFVPSTAAGAGGGALLGGPAGAAVGGALMAGSGVAARNISARMLMSPNMSKWLAQAPRMTTPQAISKHVTQGLSLVARRDPAIAQDALGLQKYLTQALMQSPSRAAAGDEKKQ